MPMSPRLLRPRQAGGFDPRAIAGLFAWWDFADLATLAQNSDGTTAVSASNDPVGYAADKSGNGYHLSQSVNNNRPLADLAAKNGRNALVFDGSNDFLSVIPPTQQALTMLAVFRPNGWGGSGTGVLFERGTARRGVRLSSSGFLQGFVEGTEVGRSTASSIDLGNWYYGGMTWNGGTASSTDVAMRVNGVTGNTISTTVSTGTNTANIAVGDRATGGRAFDGPIGEMLFYTRALTASELAQVEKYLIAKWAF